VLSYAGKNMTEGNEKKKTNVIKKIDERGKTQGILKLKG
jgi:hypothetical protein